MRHQINFQIWVDGDWHDVPTYQRSEIVITDGRQDQLSRVTTTTLSGVEINNRDGRYSPNNAMSDLYGKIGRNTRCRLLVDGEVEFVGEVESWTPRWDRSGQDRWVPIVAHGIMHRLGMAGSKAKARSALWRYLVRDTDGVRGWWPFERGSLQNARHRNLTGVVFGETSAINDGPLGSDGAIRIKAPQSIVDETDPYNGTLRLPLEPYIPATANLTIGLMVRQQRESNMLSQSGAAPMSCRIDVPTVLADGSPAAALALEWTSDPSGVLGASSISWGDPMGSSASAAVDIGDGQWHNIVCLAQTNSSNINVYLYVDETLLASAVVASQTLGRVTELINFGASYFDPDQLVSHAYHFDVAHLAVYDQTAGPGLSSMPYPGIEVMNGYAGEQAHERIERICIEEGIPVTIIGSESAQLGPQPINSALEVCFDAADTDHGILAEDRTQFGLWYRCHSTLYNQQPAVTLTWGQREIGGELLPSGDLDLVANDVTVRNRNTGAESRAVQQTGPLNVQEPVDDPQGVGPFEFQHELNLYIDEQTSHHAGWLRWRGTRPDPRYPQLVIDVDALTVQGKTALAAAANNLRLGDRIQILQPPEWVQTDSIDLMVQGRTRTLSGQRKLIQLNTVPYSPWLVGAYAAADATADDEPSRYDTAGSEALNALWLPGQAGSYASTPDNAALEITGDIDIRADLIIDWRPDPFGTIAARWDETNGVFVWVWGLNPDGTMDFSWSSDGTGAAITTAISDPVPVPANGRLAVRVTLDADPGVVTFYYSDDVDLSTATWTQLGSAINVGTTSIVGTTSVPLEVGALDGGSEPITGAVMAVQVRSGINGTVVAYPRFDEQANGTSFADAPGRVWTVHGDAQIYHDFAAGTDTELLVWTRLGPPWTRRAEALPMRLRAAGVDLTVTAVTGDGPAQVLTIGQASLAKTIDPGEQISLSRKAIYAL